MKFTVDPWDPAYGTTLETDPQQSETRVVTDVECADEDAVSLAWAFVSRLAVPEASEDPHRADGDRTRAHEIEKR